MRSARGFFAAVVFLSMLPLAIAYQSFFTSGVEIVIHLILATGSFLLSLAVFDFEMPRWLTWLGCLSTGASGLIFLLQALGLVLQNESLNYVAFQLLGQQLESILALLFIFWCISMVLTDSYGKTKLLGIVVLSAFLAAQIYSYTLSFLGGMPAEELKLIFLLVFVWLLLESAKRVPIEACHFQLLHRNR
jgi:hypothetical protein